MTPTQAKVRANVTRIERIPKEVIQLVDALIVEKLSLKGERDEIFVTLNQNEIIEYIIAHYQKQIDSNFIFDNHWLDFESIYEKDGWNVEYHKSAYNETGDSYFVFKSK